MIRLDTTTSVLKIVLSGAVTSVQLPISVYFSNKTTTTYNGKPQHSVTNDTTPITICDAPAAGVICDIDTILIPNKDSGYNEVTVYTDDGVATTPQCVILLTAGDLLQYTHANAWRVISLDGSIKGVGATGPTGPGVPNGGLTNEVLAKVDATDQNTYWRDVDSFIIAMASAL